MHMAICNGQDSPLAVVTGLCAHGLAVAHALARSGVTVVALEANTTLPGFRTDCARVVKVPEINGQGLITALNDFAHTISGDIQPVLFLTNDNMVRIVGQHWDALSGRYQMSWAGCRERLLPLLDKSSLEAHCASLGLPYPRSRMLSAATDLDKLVSGAQLTFPIIVKPTRPLSGFKVRLVDDIDGVRALLKDYDHALPFLLQEWVPGDDRQLYFTAFYLDNGHVLATYEGQKLGSNPPAMGQTTIARSRPNPAAREIAERFFAPLKLSGPVSLEVKLDQDGRPWIIEPTLGRTDYWLDCCVANGVNLPAIEYAHQTGAPIPASAQTNEMIWFDTERAPFSYLRFRLSGGPGIGEAWRPRFPYWGHADPRPAYQGYRRFFENQATRVWRRLTRGS